MFGVSQLDPSIHGKYLIMAIITVGYAIDEVAVMGGFSFCLLDIAPDFVGTLQGINGTIGFTSGFIIPMIVAALTPGVSIIDNLVKLSENENDRIIIVQGTREEWSHVFLMFGGLYTLACVIFVITGSAELQSWGKVKKKDENKEEKHQV